MKDLENTPFEDILEAEQMFEDASDILKPAVGLTLASAYMKYLLPLMSPSEMFNGCNVTTMNAPLYAGAVKAACEIVCEAIGASFEGNAKDLYVKTADSISKVISRQVQTMTMLRDHDEEGDADDDD